MFVTDCSPFDMFNVVSIFCTPRIQGECAGAVPKSVWSTDRPIIARHLHWRHTFSCSRRFICISAPLCCRL